MSIYKKIYHWIFYSNPKQAKPDEDVNTSQYQKEKAEHCNKATGCGDKLIIDDHEDVGHHNDASRMWQEIHNPMIDYKEK